MNLHLYRSKNNLSSELELSVWRQLVVPVFSVALLILLLSFLVDRFSQPESERFRSAEYQADLSTLKQKIALLEAESIRLRSFAQKMVGLAKLDKDLFSFDQPPAQGGLNGRNNGVPSRGRSLRQISAEVESLRQSLYRHSNHLERMQLILKSRQVGEGREFAMWPVSKGYISSPFGMRKDPFNGRYRKHRGIDIAGPKGTAVMSIAEGTVVFSGRKGSYGRFIEIEHENGLTSRYAHLDETVVKKGYKVSRGELIGRLGSTGRSTGPHLHLEVLKQQKHVNPLSYLSKNHIPD